MLRPHAEARTWCLEEIRSVPLQLDQPLYRNYPGMKLGQLHLVEFFSRRLCALAAKILQGDPEEAGRRDDWVITAPAFYHLPAAANLLARRVHELLRQKGLDVLLLEPRLNREQIAVRNLAEFKAANDYSKNQLQQRIAERQRIQDMAQADSLMRQFENRRVIIVNDIHVTGTQQRFIQESLNQCRAKASHWLYVFHVESSLARSHPEIEFQINNSALADLDSYARVLADEGTWHTARCISRLFGEGIDNFRYLVSLLRPDIREKIFVLAQAEGRYGNPVFNEKMMVLASEYHRI